MTRGTDPSASRTKLILIATAAVLAIIAVVVGVAQATGGDSDTRTATQKALDESRAKNLAQSAQKSKEMPRLERAAVRCGVTSQLADQSTSMSMQTFATDVTDTSGGTTDEVACMLTELEAPNFVREHIASTRALDGQQTDEWSGYSARWTYHPDNGLRITLVDTKASSS